MGVLAMVFGGVQASMTALGLASQPFSKQMMGGMGKAFSGLPRAEGQPDSGADVRALGRLTEELKLYTYLTGFAMLAFAITLIIVGWMLYKRRAQARSAAIAWAAAALVYLPVQIWVQVKIILPRTQEITKADAGGDGPARPPGSCKGSLPSRASATVVLLRAVLHAVSDPAAVADRPASRPRTTCPGDVRR